MLQAPPNLASLLEIRGDCTKENTSPTHQAMHVDVALQVSNAHAWSLVGWGLDSKAMHLPYADSAFLRLSFFAHMPQGRLWLKKEVSFINIICSQSKINIIAYTFL